MSIGIIGAGAIGSNLAQLLAQNSIEATIANSRGPESLLDLVGKLGPAIRAGTVEDAAKADVVFVAVRWVNLAQALSSVANWHNRIVIDTNNPVEFLEPNSPETKDPNNPLAPFGIKAIDLGSRQSTQVFRAMVPGARVVKAFNHLNASLLPEPSIPGGKRVLFYSGDDAESKTQVRHLIERTGYFPVDLGPLDVGGPLVSLPFGPLAVTQFA